ncbi:unnamed protein product [Phytophthora lilii]|uniref:Unnamed protein product n=1 Tax=Phytophthora lilii TaxID=2077276 RepID=A0A9W6X0W0_9STRA|nr:unnamed protein product [Phytophthora lilii]
MSRKRPRSAVSKSECHQGQESSHEEHSTSSMCRTESERSSRLSSTMLDIERSQPSRGVERQQDDAQLDRWRLLDARTVSEYGSAFSSTRLTRLLEEEDDDEDEERGNQEKSSLSRSDSDSNPSQQERGGNQESYSNSYERDAFSAYPEIGSVSSPPSSNNQINDQLEVSQCQSMSPPTSSTTTTASTSTAASTSEARLPRLRPTPPENRVVPNCCDFFTSPHPHYPKEVIGKDDESLHSVSSQTNSSSSDSASEAAEERDGNSGESSASREDFDEFEMWDYVCPQYARRVYANEWV